jgi:hypothetical protein
MPTERHIPLDVAHQVLATFGITEPTPLYERRVKPDGFVLDDLHEVLASESRFFFGIDWRAALPYELTLIAAAVGELGGELRVDVPDDAAEEANELSYANGAVSWDRKDETTCKLAGADHLQDLPWI